MTVRPPGPGHRERSGALGTGTSRKKCVQNCPSHVSQIRTECFAAGRTPFPWGMRQAPRQAGPGNRGAPAAAWARPAPPTPTSFWNPSAPGGLTAGVAEGGPRAPLAAPDRAHPTNSVTAQEPGTLRGRIAEPACARFGGGVDPRGGVAKVPGEAGRLRTSPLRGRTRRGHQLWVCDVRGDTCGPFHL